MARARRGARGHLLGLPRLDADDHRGLRALFSRTFAIPGICHWAATAFIEHLFATGVLAGIITFTVIRLSHDPHKEGRASRFTGLHTTAV